MALGPPPAVPTSFLKPNGQTPATVDKSGPWGTVLQDAHLVVSDVRTEGADNDVSVLSQGFWNTSFSSQRNSTYFPTSINPNSLLNNAWTGDSDDSGLMLLSSGPSARIPIMGTGSICEAFGIPINGSSNMPAELRAFLKQALSKGGLNAAIAPIQSPPKNPNALWCFTTLQAYVTALQLSFQFSAEVDDNEGPLAQAILWINAKLGIDISLANIRRDVSKLPDILMTLRKTTNYSFPSLAVTSSYTLSFSFALSGFECAIDFRGDEVSLLLRPTLPTTDIFDSITGAVGNPSGLDRGNLPAITDGIFTDFFDHLDVWYVKISDSLTPDGVSTTLEWGIGILCSWVIKDSQHSGIDLPIIVTLTYDSTSSSFYGNLLLQSNAPSQSAIRQSDYDHRVAVPVDILTSRGINVNQLPSSLNLYDLVTHKGNVPSIVPHFLESARVSYQILMDATILSFHVSISSRQGEVTTPTADEAPSSFNWDKVSVTARISKFDTASELRTVINVGCAMSLNPPDGFAISPATLIVNLGYDNTIGSEWTLSASINNLSVALLGAYFDPTAKVGAMDILGGLSLASLNTSYTYTGGKASSFLLSGVLLLGELELDLNYQYISKKYHVPGSRTAAAQQWVNGPPQGEMTMLPDKDRPETFWIFEAFLRVGSQSSTIGSVAESIKPGSRARIPAFVSEIPLAPEGDPTNSPVKIQYSGDDANGSTLIAWVSIGPFNLTFVQIRTASSDGNSPHLKRLLRVAVDQLPSLNHVPLVGSLPQPFDHLLYLWIEDEDKNESDPTKRGFTRGMINGKADTKVSINTLLTEMHIPTIQMKDAKKDDDSLMELQVGHHFEVISNGKIILDHVFQHPSASENAKEGNQMTGELVLAKHGMNSDPGDSSEAPATKGTTNTVAGPLKISGLSLQYKHGLLCIGIDASLVLGPLLFAMKGFTIELDLGKIRLNDLRDIVHAVRITLNGLEAAVSNPPLTIDGYFAHIEGTNPDDSTFDSYQGGVSVGFTAWNILAVGEYRITTFSDKLQSKSVFVYGKLDGPLVELELLTISGVRLGFGYNSAVTLPAADHLYDFPLISDAAVGSSGMDPMAILTRLVGGTPQYIYTKAGSNWFCAGMTITALGCVTLTAVLLFEVDANANGGIMATLLGDGILQMEPDAPADFCLFYVEVLIKVEVNFTKGYLAADAALAPASHVYVPEAHLTGAGSLYMWFPPSSHAGDWVVSIGGYHRSYSKPSHYPNPARLGLNFTVGDDIQIVGTGYAAITPKCAMAGGTLHMSLSVGPVDAHCDVALDVFVNFKPFYFVAQMSISVGVGCEIDILFIHFYISVSIGADLTIWGPHAFGGTAHVDFWFFGFDISFGDGLAGRDPIHLIEFNKLLKQPGPNSTPPPTDTITADNPYMAQHVYSLEAGLFPLVPRDKSALSSKTVELESELNIQTSSVENLAATRPNTTPFPNTGAGKEWLVHAGSLQFRIDCNFAMSSAVIVINEKDRTKDVAVTSPDPKLPAPIFAFPVQNSKNNPILSKLELRIYSMEGVGSGGSVRTVTRETNPTESKPSPADDSPGELMKDFHAEFVVKHGPKALWSLYDPSEDPTRNPFASNLQNGRDPTTELCLGVRITPPNPILSRSSVIAFDATAAMLGPEFSPFLAAPPQQTSFLCKPFQEASRSSDLWSAFGEEWSGKTDGTTPDGVKKSDIRGDGNDGLSPVGMMGMVAQTLNWTQRPPLQKLGNQNVKSADGRYEWFLKSDPPLILATQELVNYYFVLPMETDGAVSI